jgi:hypothetical protein
MKVLFFDVVWDLDDGVEPPPSEFVADVPDEYLGDDYYEFVGRLGDWLSEEFGRRHVGFDFQVNRGCDRL